MLHELPHVQISRKVATETLVFIDFAQQSTIFTAWERSSWYNFNIFHPDLAIIRSFPGSISCMSCSTRYLGCTSCHLRTYRSSRDADWAISTNVMHVTHVMHVTGILCRNFLKKYKNHVTGTRNTRMSHLNQDQDLLADLSNAIWSSFIDPCP